MYLEKIKKWVRINIKRFDYMELLFKPDWEQTKERFSAWWAHEDFGRCAIAVTAPNTWMF